RARSERVRALVRPDSQAIVVSLGGEPVIGDVTDPRAWERAAAGGEVTAIVHGAAIIVARVSLDEFMRVNDGGTRLAVETATRLRRVRPRLGPGTNHLSCVYAGNVASAILAALDARPSTGFRAYNVTRDRPPLLTQREFFGQFARELGIRVRFAPVPITIAAVGVAIWSTLQRLLQPQRYTGLAEIGRAHV